MFKPPEAGPEGRSPDGIPAPDRALVRMINFAARFSPFYRDQDWARRLREGREIDFPEIAVLAKATLKENCDAFYAEWVPPEEGRVVEKFTSGSTGIPLRILKTQRHFAINLFENHRLQQGWGFERHHRLVHAAVPCAPHMPGTVREMPSAGGRREWKIWSQDAAALAALIRKTGASFLQALASTALAVLHDHPDLPSLRLLSTFGEIAPPELDEAVRSRPGLLCFDNYGSVETGLIAGLCRNCGGYHLAHRHLLVELLGEAGEPVPSGGTGRVVVTPLFNLAMPLIRYEIGDYAVRSSCSACGGGLSFDRVLGRERNLFKLPDGTRVAPYFSPETLIELGIRQCKLVQTALAEVEFRYVPLAEDTTVSAEAAQRVIDSSVSPRLRAVPVKLKEIPRAASGKYLMHECLI